LLLGGRESDRSQRGEGKRARRRERKILQRRVRYPELEKEEKALLSAHNVAAPPLRRHRNVHVSWTKKSQVNHLRLQ